MHSRMPRRGLYVITNGPRADLIQATAAALHGGAAIVQYRDKRDSTDIARIGEAQALQALCIANRVPLIINDDVDLAARIGAAGVHLGEHDGDIAAARSRLGAAAIIGVSCYDSLDRARRLAAAGADYLAFGAFYASPTKPTARRATPDLLRDARRLGPALVAIGGISPDNAQVLIDAGADFIAVISGVFGESDPAAAARKYAALFNQGR